MKGMFMSIARIVFIAAVFCFSAAAFAQTNKAPATVVATVTPPPPATKIDVMLASKGKILIRDVYSSIAEFPSGRQETIRFGAVGVYEPNKAAAMVKAIRVTIADNHGNTQYAFIDFDEMDGLTRAAEYMSSTAITWRGQIKESTEIKYSTRSDFTFGFSQKGQQQTAFISIGSGGEKCTLRSVDDIKLIKDNAAKCVTKLNEKQQTP